MTIQDALAIIKQVLDGSVKSGLFAKTEDVKAVHEAFLEMEAAVSLLAEREKECVQWAKEVNSLKDLLNKSKK